MRLGRAGSAIMGPLFLIVGAIVFLLSAWYLFGGANRNNQGRGLYGMAMVGFVAGSILAGINSNLGDTASFTNINISGVETICEEFEGTDDNDVEPAKVGSGPSAACIYSTSDITGA